MKQVWKYRLGLDDWVVISVPKGAVIMSVGVDHEGYVCVWALVDPEPTLAKEMRRLRIVGTGHPVEPGGLRFIGTAVQGRFVWHVWEAR